MGPTRKTHWLFALVGIAASPFGAWAKGPPPHRLPTYGVAALMGNPKLASALSQKMNVTPVPAKRVTHEMDAETERLLNRDGGEIDPGLAAAFDNTLGRMPSLGGGNAPSEDALDAVRQEVRAVLEGQPAAGQSGARIEEGGEPTNRLLASIKPQGASPAARFLMPVNPSINAEIEQAESLGTLNGNPTPGSAPESASPLPSVGVAGTSPEDLAEAVSPVKAAARRLLSRAAGHFEATDLDPTSDENGDTDEKENLRLTLATNISARGSVQQIHWRVPPKGRRPSLPSRAAMRRVPEDWPRHIMVDNTKAEAVHTNLVVQGPAGANSAAPKMSRGVRAVGVAEPSSPTVTLPLER